MWLLSMRARARVFPHLRRPAIQMEGIVTSSRSPCVLDILPVCPAPPSPRSLAWVPVNPYIQYNAYAPFAYMNNLIGEETYAQLNATYKQCAALLDAGPLRVLGGACLWAVNRWGG